MTEPLVAFLGPEGTHSARAVAALHPDGVRTLPCASIQDAVDAVVIGEADEAVVPLENTTSGWVEAAVEALLRAPDESVVADLWLEVAHHLATAPGTELSGIRAVAAVAPAAQQCAGRLAELLPGVPVVDAASTAAAMLRCRDEPGLAALGTEEAAELAGLRILVRDVHDDPDNRTRFGVVSRAHAAGDAAALLLAIVPGAGESPVEALLQDVSGRVSRAGRAWVVETRARAGETPLVESLEAVGAAVRVIGRLHAAPRPG